MLFNSYPFLLVFLPVVLAGFFWLGGRNKTWALAWLTLASVLFYGWWNPKFVVLLLASIVFNHGAASLIAKQGLNGSGKPILIAAISINLLLLGIFKYANFFISSVAHISDANWSPLEIVLPLGISFFTFTQIAFLVDVFRREATVSRFLPYVLFVTYFPHLIAGPVIHHKQVMPQFGLQETYSLDWGHVAAGLTIFSIGLAKKVLIADRLAPYANAIFDSAQSGGLVTLIEAWVGAVAYTFQLYFDFSGYSDMAIGISLMFGVALPLNFSSPYKAQNIIEFWKRWHITLSTFLRDYLYIPLGGNRLGDSRRFVNLFTTMLLGGLWHGANWTFVAWGGLHGLFLCINHAWQKHSPALTQSTNGSPATRSTWGVALTFLCTVVAWVLFRADTLSGATAMYKGMVGLGGISLPPYIPQFIPELAKQLEQWGIRFGGIAPVTNFSLQVPLALIAVSVAICFFAPNTQQILGSHFCPRTRHSRDQVIVESLERGQIFWKPDGKFALVIALLLGTSILAMSSVTHFLYFQF